LKEARGELIFGIPLAIWFQRALPAGLVNVIELSPEIAVDATRLPDWAHKDPADQIIVVTARIHQLEILTSDAKILSYPHVRSVSSRKT
jgi:PIN domain nuclease of toxin-antitoxin system